MMQSWYSPQILKRPCKYVMHRQKTRKQKNKKQVSMHRKWQNHRPQINSRNHEEAIHREN